MNCESTVHFKIIILIGGTIYIYIRIKLISSKNEVISKAVVSIIGNQLVKDIEDIYEEVCVKQEMLDLMPDIFYQNDFKDGDVVTIRDLMSAMFLPSSNSAAYILGCIVGEKMQ